MPPPSTSDFLTFLTSILFPLLHFSQTSSRRPRFLLLHSLKLPGLKASPTNQVPFFSCYIHAHTRPLGTRRKRKLGRPSRTDHYYSPYYSLFLAFSIAPLPAPLLAYMQGTFATGQRKQSTHTLPLPYLTRFLSPSPFWPFSPNTRKQRRKEDGSGKKGGLRDGF